MYHQGKFYPFDSIKKALLFPGLGFGINKIRFGLVGLYLRLTNRWKPLEKTTVDQWLRKWAGDTVYETMWEPMLIGKFGERYARQVNMAWMWARLKSRTTRLGSFKGGFQAFADRFCERLQQMGVELLHVSSGIPGDRAIPRPQDFPYNDVAYTGTFVKRHVGIPVTVVNGIATLRRGDALLEAGLCDFIAYGKPFLADEAFLTHSLEDPDHEPCLTCKNCKWFSDGTKCPAQVKARKARGE
jgi:hypothetical protein